MSHKKHKRHRRGKIYYREYVIVYVILPGSRANTLSTIYRSR